MNSTHTHVSRTRTRSQSQSQSQGAQHDTAQPNHLTTDHDSAAPLTPHHSQRTTHNSPLTWGPPAWRERLPRTQWQRTRSRTKAALGRRASGSRIWRRSSPRPLQSPTQRYASSRVICQYRYASSRVMCQYRISYVISKRTTDALTPRQAIRAVTIHTGLVLGNRSQHRATAQHTTPHHTTVGLPVSLSDCVPISQVAPPAHMSTQSVASNSEAHLKEH